MKVHRWDDIKRAKIKKVRLAAIERKAKEEALRLTLKELRTLAGKTQAETARLAEMTQSELSRAERRDDHLLSTLRRYVEALGGELEVVAVLDDKRITLRGV